MERSETSSRVDRLDAGAIGLAVLVMAILGGSYTMVKIGLHDLPVFGSLLLRVLMASATLTGYALWARLPLLHHGRALWFLLAQTLFFVLSQGALYLGLTLTAAGQAAILFNTQPFFTLLLLPWFVPSERLTIRRLLGTAIAFAGVVPIVAARGTGGGSLLGDLLVLIGALGWTGNTILNRTMPRELHAVTVVLWSAAGAIPVMAALTLLLEADTTWHLTAAALGSVLYLGVLAAGIGFVLFVWLTRTYSPARVNVFVFLSPVFGVLIGWAVLGEPIGVLQLAGALAVAAGIVVVNTEPERAALTARQGSAN